ncbi:MAG: hypothetical protein ACREA2_15530 [Blastocatellia bacterium]
MPMRDKSTAPIVSPDGRFEVIIEETADRFEILYNTYLVDCATRKRLFSCEGAPRVEFAGDGMLTIHYPGYEPGGVQIDPVRHAFRTHPSEPWVPAAAWGIVESAYRRGWAQGITYKHQNQPTPFPWVAIILLLGSVVALPALGVQTFLPGAMRAALVVVAAVGVLFFGWLAASDVRAWMKERSGKI